MYTSRQLGRTAGPPAHEPAFLYAPLSATPTGTSGAITPNNPWARFNQAAPMAVTAQKKAITNHAKGSSGSPSEAPNEWSLASAGYGPMGGGIIKTKRLLTLAFDDKEAVWSLPETFAVSSADPVACFRRAYHQSIHESRERLLDALLPFPAFRHRPAIRKLKRSLATGFNHQREPDSISVSHQSMPACLRRD